MNTYKIALFDVDGVLMQQPKLFSEIYSEKYNVDLNKLLPFYSSDEFLNSSIGRYDLKQAILDHSDKWNWTGNVDELVDEWFEAERYPNHDLLNFIDELRSNGVKVYIVTQQEKYRADFLKNDVFKDKYDRFFASCDLGIHKDSIEFWQRVLALSGVTNAEEIAYFDDKPSLVELASSLGIRSFVYTSVPSVKAQFE